MVALEAEGLFKLQRTPALINIVHGSYVEYHGNMHDMQVMLDWINVDSTRNVRIVGQVQLAEIIQREDLVLALFTDESNPRLDHALQQALQDLEDVFGLAVIEITDLNSKFEDDSVEVNG